MLSTKYYGHTYVVPIFHCADLNNLDIDHQVYPAALEQFVSG